MSTPEPADTLAAARAEVQQTREELGATVEALTHKADVKARAQDKAAELKSRAQTTAHDVQARARHAAETLQGGEGAARGGAQLVLARVRRAAPAALAGIATGAAVLVAVVFARRGR